MSAQSSQPAAPGTARIIEGASSIHGRGVYASAPIASGERVLEYVGERITRDEAERREQARQERQRQGKDACVYIFELNDRHALDGEYADNPVRFINHSCEPNCRSEIDRDRIWIVANRDIATGEELTFDYGYTYREGLQHPCRCGAATCAGFIISAHQRWRLRKRRRVARRRVVRP